MLDPDKLRQEKIRLAKQLADIYRDASLKATRGEFYYINRHIVHDLKQEYKELSPWMKGNWDGSESDYSFEDYFWSGIVEWNSELLR